MFTPRKLIVAASVLGAVSVAGSSVGVPVAAASATTIASKPATGLLTPSAAKGFGFAKVVQKPLGTSKTGQAGCTKGAQAAYEDKAGKTGMVAEILVCNSTKVASSVLATQRGTNKPTTSQKPPAKLGSSAFETATAQSTYAIIWQRGKLLSVVALDVDVPASSSSSTTTTATPTPLTAKQQKTLSSLALAQDRALK